LVDVVEATVTELYTLWITVAWFAGFSHPFSGLIAATGTRK